VGYATGLLFAGFLKFVRRIFAGFGRSFPASGKMGNAPRLSRPAELSGGAFRPWDRLRRLEKYPDFAD